MAFQSDKAGPVGDLTNPKPSPQGHVPDTLPAVSTALQVQWLQFGNQELVRGRAGRGGGRVFLKSNTQQGPASTKKGICEWRILGNHKGSEARLFSIFRTSHFLFGVKEDTCSAQRLRERPGHVLPSFLWHRTGPRWGLGPVKCSHLKHHDLWRQEARTTSRTFINWDRGKHKWRKCT